MQNKTKKMLFVALMAPLCMFGKEVDIYSSPFCGCCIKWGDYLQNNGYKVTHHKNDDFMAIKEKYKIDDTAMKNWEKTFSTVIKGESELEDWYGADEPIKYLAQYQKLDRKQAMFLDSLKRKEIIDKVCNVCAIS